jgi:hypothetical protein
MRRSKFLMVFLLSLLVLGFAAHARADDSFTFTTVPNPGVVSTTPGSPVGWGYTLTNNSSTDYLVTLDVYGDVVLDTLGTVDTSIFDLPIVAPSDTIRESYDPTNPLNMFGLGQLFLDPGLTPGTTATGNFYIDAEFCDLTLTICSSTIETESSAVTINVTSPGGTPIPEPSSMLLLLSGLGGIALWFAYRHRFPAWRAARL